MDRKLDQILIGDTTQIPLKQGGKGEFVTMLGETFYKIHNYGTLAPFFMSIVSSSDQWLFIASTGGLSAGRSSAEQSLFPYYTVDKLTENSENTGNKTILLVTRTNKTSLWEPFSERQAGIYEVVKNIYKNVTGSVVIFEEINYSLGLTYRYAWRTSDPYGFVKTSWIINSEESSCQVEIVDGLQNILPANVAMHTQNSLSCLLDAYKRSEVDSETGLGIFSLNSSLTDLAEPSESLLATTVIQLGLDQVDYLLSSAQLNQFREGKGVVTEKEMRGQRCAYFIHTTIPLNPSMEQSWHLVADVCQDSSAILHLSAMIRKNRTGLLRDLENSIALNNENLEKIVAIADGLQVSNNQIRCANHFANVMFNGMRGGVFTDQYRIDTQDFVEFVSERNRMVLNRHEVFFSALPPEMEISELVSRSESSGITDLIRMCYAYLPLSFSRRHGDPSRPWNHFAINLKKADGSKKLDYEGNWRDIFQNWEALAYSYPEYIESMICTFLNATTVDGFNPYRITRQGIDWEVPEPDNPWSNIGYWSDHQIIYLQKMMEISCKVHPGKLVTFLDKPVFSYANVPYKIKSYNELKKDPYNTIDFDWEMERKIKSRVEDFGTDGKLVYKQNGELLQATLTEKLISLLLAKLINFIPEGGIWMNTQRPEWNDANNALVGKGLSVVTLCYLRRFVVFFKQLIEQYDTGMVQINIEILQYYEQINEILMRFQNILNYSFNDVQRCAMMDALGIAGSNYRWNENSQGFSGKFAELSIPNLKTFLNLTLRYVEHSLRANKRADDLYHTYNILHLSANTASVTSLYEMLEGQVAILSSGLLSGEESYTLLEGLKKSQLFVPNQQSYILYPDRKIPGFLEKNCIPANRVDDLSLISALIKANDSTLMIRDEEGNFHFNGRIRNIKDVKKSLDSLSKQIQYSDLVKGEAKKIEQLFEDTFHHDQFTGRSGTFFAYEGLGSIYWHMVSKLILAVQETVFGTSNESTTYDLHEKYVDIQQGQGFNKSPDKYGAFPTDPYSHTPKGQGAKQPGMTGLVKEEVLIRLAELGVSIENGHLGFDFRLLDKREFLHDPTIFNYWGIDGERQQIELSVGSLAYTICQVPVILQSSNQNCIAVHFSDGNSEQVEGHILDFANSKHIFQRDNRIHHLVVSISEK